MERGGRPDSSKVPAGGDARVRSVLSGRLSFPRPAFLVRKARNAGLPWCAPSGRTGGADSRTRCERCARRRGLKHRATTGTPNDSGGIFRGRAELRPRRVMARAIRARALRCWSRSAGTVGGGGVPERPTRANSLGSLRFADLPESANRAKDAPNRPIILPSGKDPPPHPHAKRRTHLRYCPS